MAEPSRPRVHNFTDAQRRVLLALAVAQATSPGRALLASELRLNGDPLDGHYAGPLAGLEAKGTVVKIATLRRNTFSPARWWLTIEGFAQAGHIYTEAVRRRRERRGAYLTRTPARAPKR